MIRVITVRRHDAADDARVGGVMVGSWRCGDGGRSVGVGDQCGGTGGQCDDGGPDVRVGGERDGEVMAMRRWGWRRAYRGWVWLCHDAVHGMAMSEVVGSCHGSAAMGVRRAYWR